MTLGAVLIFQTGCGDTFRPIATPVIAPQGNPSPADTVTLINCNGTTSKAGPLTSCAGTAHSNSMSINVPGDSVTSSADVGVGPAYAAFDVNRSFAYIPNTATDSVTAINPLTVPTTLTLPQGSAPVAAIVGSSVEYILNRGSGTVCPNLSVVSTSTLAVTATYCIGSNPSYAAQAGNNLFVLDKTLNQVNVFSTQQLAFIASIPVGTTPVYASLSFDSNFLYVLNQGSSDISIVDVNALSVVKTVPTGGSGPVKTFSDSKLIRLYVVNQGSNTVTAFDALTYNTLTPVGGATVGPTPVDVTVLPDGTRAFVANSGNNTLTEINTANFTTKAITVGSDASALVTDVASSRDGTKIYAATVTSGNLKNGVTVIRATDEVVVNQLKSPQQDPNCNVVTTSCPLQQPQQFLGGR